MTIVEAREAASSGLASPNQSGTQGPGVPIVESRVMAVDERRENEMCSPHTVIGPVVASATRTRITASPRDRADRSNPTPVS